MVGLAHASYGSTFGGHHTQLLAFRLGPWGPGVFVSPESPAVAGGPLPDPDALRRVFLSLSLSMSAIGSRAPVLQDY